MKLPVMAQPERTPIVSGWMKMHVWEQTLEEEKETDQKLTDLAQNINVQAQQAEVGEVGSRPRTAGRRKPAA